MSEEAVPKKEPTHAEVAVAAYDMFQTMLTALQLRLDHATAQNYVKVSIEGLVAPFDRAELTFIRPGGKSPVELANDMKALARGALKMLEEVATAQDDEVLKKYVRTQLDKIPAGAAL